MELFKRLLSYRRDNELIVISLNMAIPLKPIRLTLFSVVEFLAHLARSQV